MTSETEAAMAEIPDRIPNTPGRSVADHIAGIFASETVPEETSTDRVEVHSVVITTTTTTRVGNVTETKEESKTERTETRVKTKRVRYN